MTRVRDFPSGPLADWIAGSAVREMRIAELHCLCELHNHRCTTAEPMSLVRVTWLRSSRPIVRRRFCTNKSRSSERSSAVATTAGSPTRQPDQLASAGRAWPSQTFCLDRSRRTNTAASDDCKWRPQFAQPDSEPVATNSRPELDSAAGARMRLSLAVSAFALGPT